ncbi:MAG: 1-(5-phosphoribosyl)-5-[(5-phosphoribosylamino)methylideneamino]imidazole-4-carboxamide isomerase [Clostridia bacterium]|nr:1-(5-phosphoribosyl)-5-[(5-phosphoribosylamino)methylideneamino]imidazole-4-carboxamide isomerase [Clostridia bacterium]
MLIYPAIDLYEQKAVRLLRGDYNQMTVYSDNPPEIAADFKAAGAKQMHMVDLEGAKLGTTPNLSVIEACIKETGLFVEVGGGIRTLDTIEKYVSVGVGRVILGTAAVTSSGFVEEAVRHFGDKIAVGVDLKDGQVAIHGWTETSDRNGLDFCREMEQLGVSTIICTDIAKDGAMSGTNHELYATLKKELSLNIIASGGVSSIEDIKRLRTLNIHGAILGKAYYLGAVDLKEAIEVAK